MTTPLDALVGADWGKAAASVVKPLMMSRGTLLSLDIAKTKRLLEEVLGFETRATGPGRMLARHTSDRGSARYWVLEVRAAATNPTPQRSSNHWGIWVPEVADVDAAYALLSANMEKYGLARVQKPRYAHEGRRDYSMYFEDVSGNWWEIDRHPVEDEFVKFFNAGDWDSKR